MRFSQFVVPVFASSLAQALLIPTHMFTDANDLSKSSSRKDVSDNKWLVQVEYPTKFIPESNSHLDQTESILELNFTIQHKDIDQLVLNDIVIYPTSQELLTVETESLTAPRLIKSHQNKWEYVSAAKLGYSVNVDNSRKSEEAKPIMVQVDIFEVTGSSFYTTQIIELLPSKPNGKLVIQASQTRKPSTQKYSSSNDVQKCTQLLCMIKPDITKALTRTKGVLRSCHKMIQSHLPGGYKNFSSQPRPHKQQKNLNLELSNSHSHSENSSDYRFEPKKHELLQRIILLNVVPTLAGILTGISAAIIGILIGRLAVHVWSCLSRRVLNRYISIEQSDITDPERNGCNYHQIDSPLQDLDDSIVEKTN